MRSPDEVQQVLAFSASGLNDCEISRRTRIPRSTVRDWRQGQLPGRASEIRDEMRCSACGHPRHEAASLPKAAYAYLLGLYLGDGCISAQRRNVYRLRIVLDRKYPGIVRECATAMDEVMPRNRVGILPRRHENAVEVGASSRAWPCLFPQHAPGKKHERTIELVNWQAAIVCRKPERLLRGLIHSDGCRSINTIRHPSKTYVYPRYLFSNKSADIRRIFCDACDLVGVDWRVMNPEQISIARAASIRRLDEFIGPKT